MVFQTTACTHWKKNHIFTLFYNYYLLPFNAAANSLACRIVSLFGMDDYKLLTTLAEYKDYYTLPVLAIINRLL